MSFVQLANAFAFQYSEYTKTWYDPAHRHIVLRKGDSYGFLPLRRPLSPTPTLCFSYESPRSVLLARFSLDMALVALQVSNSEIQVLHYASRAQWTVKTAAETLPGGVTWSEHAGTSQDLVVVTRRGLELFKVNVSKGTCKASRSVIHTGTCAFWCSPEHRFILLYADSDVDSSSSTGECFVRGFWLPQERVSIIPSFSLPAPKAMTKFSLPLLAGDKDSHSFDPTELTLCDLYGRLYLLHYSSVTSSVTPYILDKEQNKAIKLHGLRLHVGGPFGVSVVDNMVCMHSRTAGVSLLFDIAGKAVEDGVDVSGPSACPSSSWEKLSSRELLGGGSLSYASENTFPSLCLVDIFDSDNAGVEHGVSVHAKEVYEGGWKLLSPCWAADVKGGQIWELVANLEAIAVYIAQTGRALTFLSHRGHGRGHKESYLLRGPIASMYGGGRAGYSGGQQGGGLSQMALPAALAQATEGVRVGHGTSELAKLLMLAKLRTAIQACKDLAELSGYFRAVVEPYALCSREAAVTEAGNKDGVSSREQLNGGLGGGSGGVGSVESAVSALANVRISPPGRSHKGAADDKEYSRNGQEHYDGNHDDDAGEGGGEGGVVMLALTAPCEPIASGLLDAFLQPLTDRICPPDLKLANFSFTSFGYRGGGIGDTQERAPPAPMKRSSRERQDLLREEQAKLLVLLRIRDSRGVLILQQCDIFVMVFLRLAVDGRVRRGYLVAVIAEFLACQKAFGVAIEPALPILLTWLLAAEGRESELVQLFESGLLPDSRELATLILSWGKLRPSLHSMLYLAVDMLCRLGEVTIAVYALLQHGHVNEAFRLCLRVKQKLATFSFLGANDDRRVQEKAAVAAVSLPTLPPPAIDVPCVAFFQATVEAAATEPNLDARIALFVNLHGFLSKWDTKSVSGNDGGGTTMSVLSEEMEAVSVFPCHLFPFEEGQRLLKLFGLTSSPRGTDSAVSNGELGEREERGDDESHSADRQPRQEIQH